jgi:hypothetical protein
MPASVFASLGLKFLVISGLDKAKEKEEKIFSLISPVMKVTIPGTHGNPVEVNTGGPHYM